MLAGPQPRIVTFLSAIPSEDKSALLVNLGASLAQTGNDVLLVDACGAARGVLGRLGVSPNATIQEVARQEGALDQAVRQVPQGFGIARLAQGHCRLARQHPDDARRLSRTFNLLAKQTGIVMVDGELGEEESFPVPAMASGEIVVQVSNSASSIKAAYLLVKRLSLELGRRPFGILVTGASEAEAKVVYDNMSNAASRYLAVALTSLGSVPSDEYVVRAARLGRAVVEAFPMAGASVAFRRLAGRLALPGMPFAERSAGGRQMAAAQG